ncbi:tRNA (N6-isopentenyl adenosine(37)-C2)-methylthiotransferase MiaB, partial [bacterium]|nr:tRNA (N6-isopentenyl adenosine(37)-C2)-methylthiotransferase MiaB [bacterium]
MKVYIETYGCQMNEYDSRVMASILANDGHGMAHDPGTADVVMVNTCTVRERAEARVLGRLRHLRGLMKKEAVLGIAGCVAQRLGDRLLREVPGLSFVVGTEQYWKLPDIIESASAGRIVVAVDAGTGESYDDRPGPDEASLCEFVGVMRGCNNHCSYCIVPYVRGRERSRPTSSIVDEVAGLVALGAREVTLIGQNVNSFSDEGRGFANLLGAVAGVAGLQRIRFATSHPKDLSNEVIDAVGSIDKICEHIHLPVQSGSTEVLGAMNRSYTREQYVALAQRIREGIPGVALTTDIIVGFPGETDAQFHETVSLMNEMRFDSAFMFRYSVREGTRAAELADDVPEEVKIARLQTIIGLQQRVTSELNAGLVGSSAEVLVEGPSQRNRELLFGRSRT